MSGFIDLLPQAQVPRPRESALGILLRRASGQPPRVLFGRRARHSRFMPAHLAFPGGRLEPPDEGAHRRCAAREVLEEAGVAIPEERWLPAGERTTPPMFPVRFRTLFFLAELPADAELPERPPRPAEIDLLRLAAPAEVLEEWERGAALVPPPCLPILRALAAAPADEPLSALAGRLTDVNRREGRLPQIEFQPGIWVLPVPTRTVPPATHTNVWIPGAARCAIVDPGCGRPDELERLAELVARRRRDGVGPDSILLTHHHPDHVSGAAALARELRVPVRAHPRTLERLPAHEGVSTRPMRDGDALDLGGLTLRALFTPGHAPGHLAFDVPERDSVIAGDLLSGFSTILIHPDEGDMGEYLASLERLRATGRRALLPAHGPPLPLGAVGRVIEHRRERERRVLEALGREPTPLAEIAERAYADAPELPAVLKEGQTLAHLEHLRRRGAARRTGDDPDAWTRA